MSSNEEVPMPEPWQCETAMCPNLYTADQLRAYADARCAKLRADLEDAEIQRENLRAANETKAIDIRERDRAISGWAERARKAEEERDALAEKVKALQDDARRLDSRVIRIEGRDEFGQSHGIIYSGVDLRAAIDAAGGDKGGAE